METESKQDYSASRMEQIDGQSNQQRRGFRPVKYILLPCAKLGYKNIFIYRSNKLLIESLPSTDNMLSLKQYKETKKNQGEICCFLGKKKERKYSDKSNILKKKFQEQGTYFMNNWISHEAMPCSMRSSPISVILCHLLNCNYSLALEKAKQQPITLEFKLLINNLSKLCSLLKIISVSQSQLEESFCNRKAPEIPIEKQNPTSPCNLIHQKDLQTYLQMDLCEKKKNIYQNWDAQITLMQKIDLSQMDDYFKLIFKFLSNKWPQKCSPNPYSQLLLQSKTLRLCDRINCASKLLCEQEKRVFIVELQQHLALLPNLENIVFFENNSNQSKMNRIKQICQNYMDETGDLESLAYLAKEQITNLADYEAAYQEVLMLSYEPKELDSLPPGKKSASIHRSKTIVKQDRSFMSLYDLQEEKPIESKEQSSNSQLCVICSQRVSCFSYVECIKCGHGGHLNHIMKWFEDYDNCPNVECPCLCN